MKRTLASLALAALFAGAVHAAPLDLPAQPLADALAQLARQSGAQLLFKTDDLKGLRAPALRGDLAPAEALDRLLRGSGFGFRQSGDAYVVVRVTTGDAGEARLPPIDIQAEREGAYLAHKANDVLKMNVPLKDLPMSVQVVPDTVLRDRAVTKTSQMLDNVSGIHAESSYGGNGATFFNVRGFSTSNGLRDGFREYGYIAYRDVQAIDRIEVLKGPAGTLYGGLGAIGGQVNTVSKRPEAGTFGTLSLLGGSFGQWRPSFDVNVGAERGLSFRVNGAYEQNDGFRDGAGFDSYSISPSIAWRGENDRFTLLTEFNHLERDRFDFGVPNVPVYRQLDRNRYYGLIDGVYPGYTGDFGRNSTQAVTAIYEHDLDPDWMLRVAAHYTHATQKSQQTFPDVTSFTGTTLTNYVYSGADEWSTDHAVQIELHGSTMLAGRKHQLLFGFEHSYAKHGYADSTLSSYDVDLFNPAAVNPITLLSAAGGFDNNGIGTDLGLYVNDLIDLAPDWKLLAGLRLDQFRNTSESAGASIHDTETTLSSQLGVLYTLDTDTTLFGRLGRSYLPNVGHGIGSETFPAEVGTQAEIGVKRDLFGKRMSATVALFDLTRSNILVYLPPAFTTPSLMGEQNSRGLEFDVSGEIRPGWSWIGTYAYTDATVKRDPSLPQGDALANVPRHSGSLWTTYAFSGDWQGFGIGGGMVAVGQREANLPNTYKLPGYARVDAMAWYEQGPWRAQLNIGNLLDKHYVTGGEAGVFNYTLDPSPPRNGQLTLTYTF